MAAIDDRADMQACLDYSFCNLTELAELEGEEPRVAEKKGKGSKAMKKTAEGQFLASNIKLNNNSLQDISSLLPILKQIMVDPMQMTWIDLSFNQLTKINEALCELVGLKILNLHGNQVSDIREVDKLASLPNLHKLSLHGNPIEKVKNYKCYVLCHIVNLKNFDMSSVTSNDRRNMHVISKLQPMNMKTKKKPKQEG